MTDSTAIFEEHRGMLFGIAYRMLGSVADAEDILQDAWLRWNDVDDPVDNPRAYLARTVTNLSINRLRSAAVQRESYVGPWLPEPLVSSPDAADGLESSESVSMAVLVVLESLSPLERAVFVLKEAFGFSYSEIGEAVDRTEAAVRQVGHRARTHVQERRPRYPASDEERRRVTERFVAAATGGDINAMMTLLAPEVTTWTDGGGKVRAALRPIHGADKIARWLVAVLSKEEELSMRFARVNGQLGVVLGLGGSVDSVVAFDLEDGKISAIWLVRNPEKLRGLHWADQI
ncbi:sigma-70 family RNA polymerase sigma factor [Spongiactinospora sp. TRM90649]|uniref:sigma-70 family RNA polymerase sigma factor n=1 Tax=Spongiactinospora sp. TRM90649 TaxID=3031114 RepID=UPI0023F9FA7A|nr:sigma-70 family RNA polymerase sigma factor [Spongiactinospora sp. TRM90649]MDF5755471.1 sigma-70 family RNA polymerase sigma factor [Spongiactinospora sp. TRM90649]